MKADDTAWKNKGTMKAVLHCSPAAVATAGAELQILNLWGSEKEVNGGVQRYPSFGVPAWVNP
jgi:hypothetical protein